MGDTPRSPTVSMKLQRVAQQAQRYPEMVFNNVSHLIDGEFLLEAYRQTGAIGGIKSLNQDNLFTIK